MFINTVREVVQVICVCEVDSSVCIHYSTVKSPTVLSAAEVYLSAGCFTDKTNYHSCIELL